jgi:cyclopropane-fatty-acyl-phospholipid synthase
VSDALDDLVGAEADIPQDFFPLMLGLSLDFSCAYFDSADQDLVVAQAQKHELVCQKLQLCEGERLLDVGCGWGSLLIYAAQTRGVRCVGINRSGPQVEIACRRIRKSKLSDRVRIVAVDLRDFRADAFDKVASIEMSQNVARARLGDHMTSIRRLMRPEGLLLEQCLTSSCNATPRLLAGLHRRRPPHALADVLAAMSTASLEVCALESLREHYVHTLQAWSARLAAHREAAAAIIGRQRTMLSRLYLAAHLEGYATNGLSVYQVLASNAAA